MDRQITVEFIRAIERSEQARAHKAANATTSAPDYPDDWNDPTQWKACPDGQHQECADDDAPASCVCVDNEA